MIAQTCDVLHSNTQISRHVFFFVRSTFAKPIYIIHWFDNEWHIR